MRCKNPRVTMTSKSKPPMMTHQPGLPADSASCEKPGSSPKSSSITPKGDLMQCIGWEPKQGDLVFSWHVFEEEYVPYQFEAHLCSKVAPLCWVINLRSGKRVRKKLSDLWIPRT